VICPSCFDSFDVGLTYFNQARRLNWGLGAFRLTRTYNVELDLYRREHPATGQTCSGPLWLEWARKRYGANDPEGPLTPECAHVIQSLRKILIGDD